MRHYPQFVNNLCVEKELKVRVKELYKYRGAGLTNIADLIPFEKQRFKAWLPDGYSQIFR